VAFAIIREDMLDRIVRDLPTMMSFRTHVENNSMFNTPPVFPIYVLKETLKWLKSIGGVDEIYRRNKEKAALLYDEIDRNPLFRGTVEKEDRSLMNICFVMAEGCEELAPEFMEFAKSRGMVGIKGHRLVGGFRASCYNALPKESVEALVPACRSSPRRIKNSSDVSDHRPADAGDKKRTGYLFHVIDRNYEDTGCNGKTLRQKTHRSYFLCASANSCMQATSASTLSLGRAL